MARYSQLRKPNKKLNRKPVFSSAYSSTKLEHWGGRGEAHALSPVSLGKVVDFIQAERKNVNEQVRAFSLPVMLKKYVSVGMSSLKGHSQL